MEGTFPLFSGELVILRSKQAWQIKKLLHVSSFKTESLEKSVDRKEEISEPEGIFL